MGASPAVTPRIRAPRSGDLRNRILDAAEELFAELGYFGVSARRLATRVGVAKSVLFHYYATKTDVYDAAVTRALQRLQVATAAQAEFERWLACFVRALVERPSLARLLLRALFEKNQIPRSDASSYEPVEDTLTRVLAGLRASLAAELRCPAGDPQVGYVAQTVIGSTIYHFASGSMGSKVTGVDVFDPESVGVRAAHVMELIRSLRGASPAPRRCEDARTGVDDACE